MAAKTDYLEDAILNHVLRNTALTSPTTVYVGLTSTATDDAGGGTELTGDAYARQAVTFGAPSPAGTVANSVEVLFPEATGAWSAATHFFIADLASAGNRLYHGILDAPRTAALGDQIRFAVGALIVNEA